MFRRISLWGIIGGIALGVLTASASAQTSTSFTVTETSPFFPIGGNHVVCAPGDSAPGYSISSLASDGILKSEMYFPPEVIFGREVLVGEVASISYFTKKDTTHTVSAPDWALLIYTKPFAGDVSTPTWYGARIGSEPYFAANLNDPANAWNQWSTDGTDNTLRFYESTQGAPGANFGAYTDPDFDTFIAQNSLGTVVPYEDQKVLYFSIQTGSAWATGFTGQLDGFRIELLDGSVATINFECDDSDDDGVLDEDDHCPLSDLDGFVVVGSVTTTINNATIGVNEDGCSIQDLVNECEDNAKNHGQFVSCITQLANDLYKAGVITKQQRDQMKTGAAKSSVGK